MTAFTVPGLTEQQAHKITGTPNDILNTLKKVLKPNAAETYTVTIWKSASMSVSG